MSPRTVVSLLLSALAAAAALAAACGDSHDVADGGECSTSGDCVSNLCEHGRCAGKQCSCAGTGCPEPGPCDEGWRCGPTSAGLACRRTCGAERPCPSGETCDEGVCVAGSGGAKLAWVTRPGDQRCALAQRCRYEVRVEGAPPESVRTIAWDFGDDAGVEETDAAVEHFFPLPGTYRVQVRAKVDGTQPDPTIDATEHVCIADEETDCRKTPDDCCGGTCTLEGRCR